MSSDVVAVERLVRSRSCTARCRWRLAVLLTGMLFAGGRRTVASWLRAAGVRADAKAYSYFISVVGHRAESIAGAAGGTSSGSPAQRSVIALRPGRRA